MIFCANNQRASRLSPSGAATLILLMSVVAFSAQERGFQQRAAGDTVVLVATETVMKSDRIRLGDIAQVLSGDTEAKERLRKIELGYAPDIGAIRELTLEKIALAIRAAGLPAGTVSVEGPPMAFIKRATQVIDPSAVREAVERVVLKDLRAMGAAARLVRLDLPPTIEVASGATEVRASTGKGCDLFSPFIASIEIWNEERVIKRFTVMAQAEAFAPVLVAARDLPAGTRVREQDVKAEPRRINRLVSNYVRDAKALRGVALKRGLALGDPLTNDALFADIAVKPGDMVRVIGRSGLLYLEVKGEARSAGRVGDRVQVKNVQTGVILQAVVENEGVVRVHF